MKIVRPYHVYFLLLILSFSPTISATEQVSVEKVLTESIVEKNLFLPGYGVRCEIPKTCYYAKVELTSLIFFDLDNDGLLEVNGDDGIAFPGGEYVVALYSEMLLKDGQYTIGFSKRGDKTILESKKQKLYINERLLYGASIVSYLRYNSGLPLVSISEKASKACEKHIRYLKNNPSQIGMELHNEYAGKKGFSREGAKAGKESCIYPSMSDLTRAVEGFYRTPWHGSAFFSPNLCKIGVASIDDYCMLYLYKFREVSTCKVPMTHPFNMQKNVVTKFCKEGETPSPLPGRKLANRGMPIYMILSGIYKYKTFTRADIYPIKIFRGRFYRGEKLAGTVSSPANPANPKWPTNSNLALFLPHRPLTYNTLYEVEFYFEDIAEPFKWTFSTGKNRFKAWEFEMLTRQVSLSLRSIK